jgi:glycosyl transferase family 87
MYALPRGLAASHYHGHTPMPEETAAAPSPLRRALEFVVVAICVLTTSLMLLGIIVLLITGNHPGGRDVISFWAAGRQVASHADPYAADSILRLERTAEFPASAQSLIMRNPPSALALVLPLAAFQPRGASLLWSLLLLASLGLAVHLFWEARGRPPNKLHLLGYCFGPALICVLGGQSGLFALLGLVLFLRLHREHSFLAGMALWFCALKPHLFLPFGVVMLLWVAQRRKYGVLAGTAVALAASSALAMWLDPAVWRQYFHMMHSPNIQAEFIPTLGYGLRRAVRPGAVWLQYLPAMIGCCWAVYFFRGRRERWDWMEDGALVMLVSLLVSPYAWVTDHAIVIPALLAGAYRATLAQIAVLAVASSLLDIGQLLGNTMHSPSYILVPPFWLGWYLYVIWQGRSGRRIEISAPDVAAAGA